MAQYDKITNDHVICSLVSFGEFIHQNKDMIIKQWKVWKIKDHNSSATNGSECWREFDRSPYKKTAGVVGSRIRERASVTQLGQQCITEQKYMQV